MKGFGQPKPFDVLDGAATGAFLPSGKAGHILLEPAGSE